MRNHIRPDLPRGRDEGVWKHSADQYQEYARELSFCFADYSLPCALRPFQAFPVGENTY